MTQNDYNLLAGAQYDATYSDLTELNQQQMLAQEKAKRLAIKAEEKINTLKSNRQDYANLSATGTLMSNGLWESNGNKIWNNLSDTDIQTMLSEAANQSLIAKDGKYFNASTGEEYTGDVRRAYMYGTKADDNAVKFGLARGDLPSSDYRYQPGRAESEGYNVGKKGYGWDAGESGVDLNKNYMDMLLPYDKATALEAAVHGRTDGLKNRLYKDISDPTANDGASGVSEYYTSTEGVLGDTGNASVESINASDETLLDQYSKIVPANKYAKNYTEIAKKINAAGDTDGRLSESLDLAQSAGLKLYADMDNMATKAVRSLLSTIGISDESVEKVAPKDYVLPFTGEKLSDIRKSQELRDNTTGYSTRYEWDKEKAIAEKLSGEGKHLEAAWNIFTNFDRYLAESAPEMAAMFVPYVGLPAVASTRLSEQMEDFKKTNDRDMTVGEAFASMATILPLLYAEKGIVKTGVGGVIENLGKGAFGKAAVGVGATTVGEGLQEWGEYIQEDWSTGKAEDRTDLGKLKESATSDEAVFSATAGSVVGGTLRGAGEAAALTANALPGVVDATRRGIELATETPVQKEQREAREFSSPLKESAVNAAILGDSNTVKTNAEQIHGKISEQLDASADNSLTYGVIFKEALAKASTSNNEQDITNVYKAMAELDQDENTNFKVKDLVDEITYSATQDFIRLINQKTDASDEVLKNLGKEVTESLTNKANVSEDTLREVNALKLTIEAQQKNLKSVMGSDQFNTVNKDLEKLKVTIDDYIKGKDLNAVNNEFAELGFIVASDDNNLIADPNRPGLKVYERELKNQLLNTKTNKNLLNEKVTKSAKVKLTGLTNFAESRLRKLDAGKYQSKSLIESSLKENEEMLETINNVLNTAKGLTSIDETTKKSYTDELLKAAKSALAANKELERRQKLLDSVEGESGLVFELTKDGSEIIQKITGKDSKGKYKKVKVADVVDNKVELVEGYKGAKSVDEETTPAKEEVKRQVQPEEVMTKDKFKEEAVKQVKNIIKEKAGKPELYTKEEEQIIENAKYSGVLQEATKELMKEVKQPKPYSGPLAEVRQKAAEVDKELGLLLDGVKDMDVKQNIKTFFNKKLNEVKEDKAKVNKLIDRLETTIDNRANRKYSENSKLLKAIVSQIDNLVKGMLKQLARLTQMVRGLNQKHKNLRDNLNALMTEIEKVESAYKSATTKTTLGKVSSIDEELYGVPVLEVNDTRIEAPKRVSEKTGKEVAQSTAINDAMELVKLDKITELRDELKSMPKGQTSLNAKLIGRLLLNFPMNNAVHKIIKRTNDSVFGKLTGNPFADVNRLLEVLPKSFKEFFASDKESREALKENIETMATYLDNTEVGKIIVGENSLLKTVDNNGLAIRHINEYVPITREIVKGDRVEDSTKKRYIVEEVTDNSIKVITIGKNPTKSNKTLSDFTGVLEQQEESVPVNILELIGTVKDGELQIDEQTKNILKFYSAKMLSDSNTMIGKILSFDESEMSQYLGITDPDEQIKVKQEAAQGYINSASIRKDIGSEVYQALGVKFNEITPEFTEESFKSALGVLVQAIAVDNGSMGMKSDKTANKNQNLIKTNWESIYKVTIKDGKEFSNKEVTEYKNSLIKSINKLQYMNENRNRPLPSLKKPIDNDNRVVMNTQNTMDKKSTEFLNKQEKIAYTLSPKLKTWLDMDEKDALKALGKVDIETANLHVSEIDAQIARNDKLVREWEILKTFAKSVGNKKFYLKWGQTVSGRYTILNDMQYQESKLHREYVVAEGSEVEVDPKDESGRQMLEASIMQGLDMDPDKLSAETASEEFNKVFNVTDKGIEVVEEGPIKQAYEALKEGKVDVEAMANVFSKSLGHHGVTSIDLLVDWDKALKNGTKISTHANLEIDAITSGMVLTLLQIGSDQAIQLAEKGGIYTTQRKEELEAYVKEQLNNEDVKFTPGALIEAGKKHATKIESRMRELKDSEIVEDIKELANLRAELENDSVFKDLYSTIGVAMIGEVQAYEAKLRASWHSDEAEMQQLAMLEQIGELNLKNIRSIAKSPVMVYIYGATISSIKQKLTYSLGVETFVKALKTASKKLKNGEEANKELEFISKFVDPTKEEYVDWLGSKIDTPKERWEQLLALNIDPLIENIDKVINATFGKAIEKAFESRLGFVDKNRNAAKSIEMLVFEAYQIRLADEVKKQLYKNYRSTKHKGEMYKLSKEDIQNINNRLTTQGFGHNIVWDEADGRVNQTLNKTGDKGGIHSTKVQVGNVTVGGQIKQFKPLVNTGAAPTISIHAIDGRMMMDVLNRELEGEYAGGNVYDAVVLSLDKAMLEDTANTYNSNMIETGFSRSIVADQLNMLENMLAKMSKSQYDRMLDNIGLRPKGELRDDYTKEANRLGLGIGKMLESLETSEEVNKERIVNSSKEYYSGHLFQMGSGVVKVEAGKTRAKEFPAIDTIKKLLNNRLEEDRKVTHKEFADKGITLHSKTDYVFNLNDIINRETQVQSKANVAKMEPYTETTIDGKVKFKIKVSDKLWNSLSSKDTVEIIGEYKSDKLNSQTYWYKETLKKLDESGASIVINGELAKGAKSENIKTYTVYPKAKPDMVKAKYKASKATKYVGYGKAGSSTELYAKQLSEQGMPVNTGKYDEKDVVFVSVNGIPNREDYVNTLKQVIAALESGATVLTDSESYLSKSTYNKGEIQLAKNLMNRGYTRTTDEMQDVGVWVKNKNSSAQTNTTKEQLKPEEGKMTTNEIIKAAKECAKG